MLADLHLNLRHAMRITCTIMLVASAAGCDVRDADAPESAREVAAPRDTTTGAADRTHPVPDTLAPTRDAGDGGEPGLAGDVDKPKLAGDAAEPKPSRDDGEPEPAGDRGAQPTATASELATLAAALIIPVEGVDASDLRDTFTEARGDGRVHDAIDIPAARGTPVLSATDGRLLRLFDSRPGGLMVYATDASERFILLYGHLDSYADGVRNDMPLVRGQIIGYVGTSGNAPPDTPHLHFGILRGDPAKSWSGGDAVNPYPLLVRTVRRRAGVNRPSPRPPSVRRSTVSARRACAGRRSAGRDDG